MKGDRLDRLQKKDLRILYLLYVFLADGQDGHPDFRDFAKSRNFNDHFVFIGAHLEVLNFGGILLRPCALL